jgi:N-acetylglucosaminyl-diphospho-decaprenol L-rhamnosyltransferase
MFGEAVQRLRNRFESRAWVQGPVPRVLRALGDRGWFTAACGLVRRRAWDAVGGFDPGFFLYFEDADLGVRLREVRWVSKEIAAARAIHDRRRPRASSDAAVRYRQSQLRYYRKHRPPWESRLLLRKLRRDAARIEDVATRVRLRQVCEESEPRS